MSGEKKRPQPPKSSQQLPAAKGKPQVESSTSSSSQTETSLGTWESFKRWVSRRSTSVGYSALPTSDLDTDRPAENGGDVEQPDEEPARLLPISRNGGSQDKEQRERRQEDKKATDRSSSSNTSRPSVPQPSTAESLKKLSAQPVSQSNALPSTTPLSPAALAEAGRRKKAYNLVATLCRFYDKKDISGSTLEYTVRDEELLFSSPFFSPPSKCLLSKPLRTQDVEQAFEHISKKVEKLNAVRQKGEKKLEVEIIDNGKGSFFLRIEGFSDEELEYFIEQQQAFLSVVLPKYKRYDQARKEKSIHAFLKQDYLEKGHLDWGVTVIQKLLGEPAKINEIDESSERSPLQHALFSWVAIKRILASNSIPVGQNSSDNPPGEILRYLEEVINVLLNYDFIDVNISTPRAPSPLAIAVSSGNAGLAKKFLEKKAEINEAVLDSLLPLSKSDFEEMFKCLFQYMNKTFLSKTALPKIEKLLKLKVVHPGQENVEPNCIFFAQLLFCSPYAYQRKAAEQIASSAGYRLIFNEDKSEVQIKPLEGGEGDAQDAAITPASLGQGIAQTKARKPAVVTAGAIGGKQQAGAISFLSSSSPQEVQATTISSSTESEPEQVDAVSPSITL